MVTKLGWSYPLYKLNREQIHEYYKLYLWTTPKHVIWMSRPDYPVFSGCANIVAVDTWEFSWEKELHSLFANTHRPSHFTCRERTGAVFFLFQQTWSLPTKRSHHKLGKFRTTIL